MKHYLLLVATLFFAMACEEKGAPKAPEQKPQPTQQPWTNPQQTDWDSFDNGSDNNNNGLDWNSGSLDEDSDEDCTENDCPKGDVDVKVDGSKTLTGRVGSSVRWDFRAEPRDYDSHDVVVYKLAASPSPSALRLRNNESEDVSLDWIPAANDPATGTVSVTVRDMTACEVVEESEDDCEDFNSKKSKFDTTVQMEWRIDGATGTNINGTDGSSIKNQLLLAVGLGALQGAMSGQGIQGIFSGALSGLSNLGGGMNGLNSGIVNTGTTTGTQTGVNTNVPQTP